MELIPDSKTTDEWSNRCSYWQSEYQKQIPKRKRRERPNTGLVLTGFGLVINVDKGRLIIKDGMTHHPQKNVEYEFFPGALDIPLRIVIVDGKGSITLDALDWMAEQSVDLIRLTYDGQVRSVMSANGYAADPKKIAWQNKLRADDAARLRFAVPVIKQKIEASLFNLENLLPESQSRDKAIAKSKELIKALRRSPPKSISELLAIEGTAAQGYFFSWRALQLKWENTKSHPIPDEWRNFFSRSSLHASGLIRPRNRYATHPVNAMLNYVYSSLESRVRIEVVADGYDPALGIIHDQCGAEKHSFVFDRMEPLRPVVDRAVLRLAEEETFSGADFQLQSNGVVRVNPELARRLVDYTHPRNSN